MRGAPALPPSNYLLRNEDLDIIEDEASKQRGRKRVLLVVGGALLALAVVGVCIGVGVGVGKRNSKSKHSPQLATAPAPATAASSELKYLPEPGTPEAAELMRTGSDTTKLLLQLAEDARSITPNQTVAFLDFFDKAANLTARGVDVEQYKEQAYFLRLWFQARGYQAVLQLLRDFSQGKTPSVAQMAEAVEQLFGVLKGYADFQAFRSWPADKDTFTEEQLATRDLDDARLIATGNTIIPAPAPPQVKFNAATDSRRPKSLLMDPYKQYTNVINPAGWMNNPTAMGNNWFKPIVIPIVFHVLMFRDEQGYLAPANAYRTGNSPGRYLVDVMNRAYKASSIQFRLHEWRADPKTHSYLDLGTLSAWQTCSLRAEPCTCPLAVANNMDPRQYLNVWVSGSVQLPGLPDDSFVGYSTLIAPAKDTCAEVLPGWKEPKTKSAHLWLRWDQADPDGGNSDEAYNDGPATIIHEVGHYLGLSHTHQGDCLDQDGIRDTPPNACADYAQYRHLYNKLGGLCRAAWRDPSRPVPLDQVKDINTCPGDAYIDNIMNYMSYVPSECYKLFTTEQVKRMQRIVEFYHQRFTVRGSNAPPGSRTKAPPNHTPPKPKAPPKRTPPKPKGPPKRTPPKPKGPPKRTPPKPKTPPKGAPPKPKAPPKQAPLTPKAAPKPAPRNP